MGRISRTLLGISAVALSAAWLAPAYADGHGDPRFAFVQTNLVSNLAGAAHQDKNLLNAWGVAFPPGGSFWVNANNAGLSLLYDGLGVANTHLPSVTIPQPPPPHRADITGTTSTPTGIIWNPTSGFALPGTTDAAAFIFDSEDGTITAWSPSVNLTNAVVAVDNSNTGTGGAVYKGLTLGLTATGAHLYATNFRSGTVDVYDSTFTANLLDGQVPNAATATNIAGTFSDPHVPKGFAPFNIQNINGDLYVSYALQDQPKHAGEAARHLAVHQALLVAEVQREARHHAAAARLLRQQRDADAVRQLLAHYARLDVGGCRVERFA